MDNEKDYFLMGFEGEDYNPVHENESLKEAVAESEENRKKEKERREAELIKKDRQELNEIVKKINERRKKEEEQKSFWERRNL